MSIAVEAALGGGTYIWGAPTFDQVRIGFAESKRAMGGYADFNMSRMTADLPGSGRIVYRSLDNPDNARGHTADGVVLDEAAYCKPEAWYEVLRPMLIDTGGWAWGIGTPDGKNWFYQEHLMAGDHDDVMAWQIPTLGIEIVGGGLVRKPHPLENPNVAFEEIDLLFRTMPERIFRQEILGEFIESGGGVFRHVSEAATSEAADPERGHQYVMGVDWGRKHDFTVFSVLDLQERRQVYLDRFTSIDYEIQTSRLRNVIHRYRPTVAMVEYNAMGGPIVERLQSEGLPIQGFDTTNKTKEAIIRGLESAFDNYELRILDDRIQTAELLAYEQQKLTMGWRFSAPDGMHDDTVMALALAWHVIASRPPSWDSIVGLGTVDEFKSRWT